MFTRSVYIMYGHDYEKGHDCPKCGKNSRCMIEDGFCENDGVCDNCIKERVYQDIDREYWGEYDYDE